MKSQPSTPHPAQTPERRGRRSVSGSATSDTPAASQAARHLRFSWFGVNAKYRCPGCDRRVQCVNKFNVRLPLEGGVAELRSQKIIGRDTRSHMKPPEVHGGECR